MKERLEALNNMSRELYEMTKGKDTISRSAAQTLQAVFDDMQDELDQIMNELTRLDLQAVFDDMQDQLDQIMNELTRPEGCDLKSDPLTKRQK